MARQLFTADVAPGRYPAAGVTVTFHASNSSDKESALISGQQSLIWFNSGVTDRVVTVTSTPLPPSNRTGDLTFTLGGGTAYTDVVIDGADNTLITSAGQPFTTDDIGKLLKFTAGTGFTHQTVQITAVDGGNVATCNRAVGTTSSTGGTGTLLGETAVAGPFHVDGWRQNANGTLYWEAAHAEVLVAVIQA